jgi:hypothetical protein
MKAISKITLLCLPLIAGGVMIGCFKAGPRLPKAEAHHHQHKPPHSGTAVELGDEEYHVEFVRDASAGKLQAFVLDGELENFVRIAGPALKVVAQFADREETLIFLPKASNATGETVGDTSLFEAQADWLQTTPSFHAVLKEITVRGKTYTNTSFDFPKGSDETAKN